MKTSSIFDQSAAAFIDTFNQLRIEEQIKKLNHQDELFHKAVQEINKVRDFIGKPENILGNPLTKHGEIAEQVEVGVTNAKAILAGLKPRATFENVGRTAPVDYMIDGIAVQSKYINGAANTLKHVLEHLNKYEQFQNGNAYYHIPKDQFEIIQKILNNQNIDNLSSKTIRSIQTQIRQIEEISGRKFSNIIKSGTSTYAEVQQGNIHETLNKHETELQETSNKAKEDINQESEPSLTGGLKVAGVAAAISATLSLSTGLYNKYKTDGKNPFKGDLNLEDWKELGLQATKDGAMGGISGLAIYGLTNFSGLSAPLAGAIVSASKGVGVLIQDFCAGNIGFEEFQMNAIFICADSAGVGLAALAGQTLIPIPIIGAVIGSIAGKFVCNLLFEENKELAIKFEESLSDLIEQVEGIHKDIIDKISADFDKIQNLQNWAFNLDNNMNLVESSIALAHEYGVEEYKILKNEQDLKNFLFN